MQILMLLLVIMISSCAPIKYSHDYFLDCEDKHSDFKSLSSCAFEEIKQDCEDKPDVLFNHPTLVNLREQLLDDNAEPPEMCKTCNLIGDPGW